MNDIASGMRTDVLGLLGLVATAVAAWCLGSSVASPTSPLFAAYENYVAYLNKSMRGMFMPEAGKRIVLGQVGACAAVLIGNILGTVPYWPIVVSLIVVGPYVFLVRARRGYLAAIEDQIDGFIGTLANSLKTVPSPGAALEACTVVLRQPMRQEVEQVLREMRVGSTLDQALVAMSSRLGSKSVDVAFSAVLIGLKVGGNLPIALERTASTIREMNRLLGVVRSKTGEGRAQLWVLALFPLGAIWAFNAVSPGYFDPMQVSIFGQIAIGIAVTLWIAALLMARKILAVDI